MYNSQWEKLMARVTRGTDNLYRTEDVGGSGPVLINTNTVKNFRISNDEKSSSSDEDNYNFYNYDNQLRDWNNRLEHPSKKGIFHLARIGKIQIRKSDLNRKLDCINCKKGKAHAKRFNKKGKTANLRTSRPFELLYSDTCGWSVLNT